jgi:hypothetical protein
MDPGIVKLIELLVIVGAVFGFGFWQLASLRRDKREREEAKRATRRDANPDQDNGGE